MKLPLADHLDIIILVFLLTIILILHYQWFINHKQSKMNLFLVSGSFLLFAIIIGCHYITSKIRRKNKTESELLASIKNNSIVNENNEAFKLISELYKHPVMFMF